MPSLIAKAEAAAPRCMDVLVKPGCGTGMTSGVGE